MTKRHAPSLIAAVRKALKLAGDEEIKKVRMTGAYVGYTLTRDPEGGWFIEEDDE